MSTQSKTMRNDHAAVPAWAIVLAVIAFAGMQVLFLTFLGQVKDPPPFALRVFLGLLTGAVLATWVTLIGYVNRDAGRRGMSRALWTLVGIFVPNGIGLILYFVLRRPLLIVCPQCGTAVAAKANYCPQCSHPLAFMCSHCGHAVGAADAYCLNCGHPLRKGATKLEPMESKP